ncbi:hypothetical protein SCANM63S_04403 [Streptomyces canarius]
MERSSRRHQPVRLHRRLRELPLRRGRPGPARPDHGAGAGPGADQLPAQRGRRARGHPGRAPGLRPGRVRRRDGGRARREPAHPADRHGHRPRPPPGRPAAAGPGRGAGAGRPVRRTGRRGTARHAARGVPAPGPAHPGRPGRPSRRHLPHLSRTRRALQPVGAAPHRRRCRTRALRRPVPAPHRRPGRGTPRRAEERRGLSPGRPPVPGRARRVPLRGRTPRRRDHGHGDRRTAARGTVHPDPAGRGPGRRRAGHAGR